MTATATATNRLRDEGRAFVTARGKTSIKGQIQLPAIATPRRSAAKPKRGRATRSARKPERKAPRATAAAD